MNILQQFVCHLYTSPELKREYKLEKATGVVRIHGLRKDVNFKQGYKDIEQLYPKDSQRLKRDFTLALLKICAISIVLVGFSLWWLISSI